MGGFLCCPHKLEQFIMRDWRLFALRGKQILLMFVKNFFLEVAQKKGRTKRTHQIAGFETMM